MNTQLNTNTHPSIPKSIKNSAYTGHGYDVQNATTYPLGMYSNTAVYSQSTPTCGRADRERKRERSRRRCTYEYVCMCYKKEFMKQDTNEY